MKTAIINTPLGFTEICGDENGISKIHILNEETEISTKIPKELKKANIDRAEDLITLTLYGEEIALSELEYMMMLLKS